MLLMSFEKGGGALSDKKGQCSRGRIGQLRKKANIKAAGILTENTE